MADVLFEDIHDAVVYAYRKAFGFSSIGLKYRYRMGIGL